MRRVALMSVFAASLAGTGCVGLPAALAIAKAEVAIEGARAAQADKNAPYEYTTAELYLEKAKEERGYADFSAAMRFADHATQMAHEAKESSQVKVREEPLLVPTGPTPATEEGSSDFQEPKTLTIEKVEG